MRQILRLCDELTLFVTSELLVDLFIDQNASLDGAVCAILHVLFTCPAPFGSRYSVELIFLFSISYVNDMHCPASYLFSLSSFAFYGLCSSREGLTYTRGATVRKSLSFESGGYLVNQMFKKS